MLKIAGKYVVLLSFLCYDSSLFKYLEKELDAKKDARKKGVRPPLTSSKKESPEALKQKLLEKEAQAALNRQKEKEKLAAKIAAQEERAKRVLERKKQQVETGSDDSDGKLSYGGEKDSADGSSSNESRSRPNSSEAESGDDQASPRSGSAKSSDTDTTDVADDEDASSPAESVEDSPVMIKKQLAGQRQSNQRAAVVRR